MRLKVSRDHVFINSFLSVTMESFEPFAKPHGATEEPFQHPASTSGSHTLTTKSQPP
jgi:hypothetical protein